MVEPLDLFAPVGVCRCGRPASERNSYFGADTLRDGFQKRTLRVRGVGSGPQTTPLRSHLGQLVPHVGKQRGKLG
jgi:hypothetical protein